MKNEYMHDLAPIREVKTFQMTMNCPCGGVFVYNVLESGCTDLFESMFNSIAKDRGESVDPYKYEHTCNKCGKKVKFTHTYPLSKTFQFSPFADPKIAGQNIYKVFYEDVKADYDILEELEV